MTNLVKNPEVSEQENKKDEYTGSEEEELGLWYDMPFTVQNTLTDKETSESFSLDLDIQPEELQPVREREANREETRTGTVEHSDLQEASNTETETQETITPDTEPDSQDDL